MSGRPIAMHSASLWSLWPLPHGARDEALFARVVAAAFSQRRKTLRNSLRNLVTPEDFAALDIAPGARAQELSVAQFVALADRVGGRVEV